VVFTWSYDEVVCFDGEYEAPKVHAIGPNGSGKSAGRALARLKDVPRLRRLLVEGNVDLVFVQSEYDVALVYLATRGTSIPYRFLIFGQNFQFPEDFGKYTLMFRRHLETIIRSCPGYRDTVSVTPPRIGLVNRIAMEVISVIRYAAVRSADKLFAFSEQIAWETQLLFGRRPDIVKGAFRESMIGHAPENSNVVANYGLTEKKYILSLSRLAPKKRVGLIIEAFAKAKLGDAVLVIGGAGPEAEHLQAIARDTGLGDRIRFIGRVPDQHLHPLKRGAGAFVSMDIGDYDISPLEALLLETPIILPTEFDAEPALRATNGVTICEANVGGLAKAMSDVFGQPAQPSRELLESYTWERYFASLVK
jgi:glycosyltransferase involved in cell wall biosynthesis